MEFLEERIGEVIRQIGLLRYGAVWPIKEWICKSNPDHPADVKEISGDPDARIFRNDEYWGRAEKYYGFVSTVRIGKEQAGCELQFSLTTGREGEWDATNPQFLLYVNGEIRQGMDVNHRDCRLGVLQAGDEIRLALQAYAGENGVDLKLKGCIRVLYPQVEQYYYDLLIPYQTACLLDQNDKTYWNIINSLNESINLLDLRVPHSEAFEESLQAASDYFQKKFYGELCGSGEDGTQPDIQKGQALIYCVGHTHIDVAWLWTLAVTRQKAVRSFATVVNLMEQYPEYIFMSSQPQLYQYVKEDAPELYEKIKELVKQGRWEVEGSMWLEPDCNIPSGEAFVRQFLYGKRFFREEFGKDNKILWLPDVFGYSAALPQIMKKCGVPYFMTTKISWNDTNKLPYDSFYWEGIDGTRVLTHFITTRDYESPTRNVETSKEYHTAFSTNYNGYTHPAQVKGSWQRYQQKDLNEEVLLSYGYGDGGGGTTDWMIESVKRMNKGIPGVPRTRFSTAGEFFEVLEKKLKDQRHCPVWSGELYLENHRATYTTMARNKRSNRKSEFLMGNAEFLTVLDHLAGEEKARTTWNKDKSAFDEAWRTILKNQFHDILPGSAIEEVYEVSQKEYEAIENHFAPLGEYLAQKVADKMEGNAGEVFVLNSNGTTGGGLLKIVPKSLSDVDKITEMGGKVQQTADGGVLVPVADVPAKSCVRLSDVLCCGLGDEQEGMLRFGKEEIENRYYHIVLNEKGQMTSFYDKEAQRELLQPGRRGNLFMTYEDKPHRYDNWNFYDYHREKSWEVDQVKSCRILERGPVRWCLEFTWGYLSSEITEKLYFYPDRRNVDMEIDIDWREDQIFLKLLYPVQMYTKQATFEIQYGLLVRNMVRNTSWYWAKFEVCFLKWMDISENSSYGVSFLNDCKYGVSVNDNEVGLSLIKSGMYPNPHADREHHHILYSIYPHMGDWRTAGTVAMAYELNNPMQAVCKRTENGDRKPGALLAWDASNVVLETVKPAEDGEGWIARLYEAYGSRTCMTVQLPDGVRRVWRTNLLEQKEEELEIAGGSITLWLTPYEIMTLYIV